MVRSLVIAAALLAVPAGAQDSLPQRTIEVTGTGVVRTPPDVATLAFWIMGEGATPDAATKALVAKQKAVIDGVRDLLGGASEITTGEVIVIEARDQACDNDRRPKLSEGACAVVGYVASMQGGIRTRAVDQAGTAAALASKLGASDARLQRFALSDPGEAMRRATAEALADARRRAEAAASGAGVRLGALLTIRDQNHGSPTELVVRAPAPPPPEPALAAPLVQVEVKPAPIETRTQIWVSYAIAP